MKTTTLKLGTKTKELSTGLKGMLTLMEYRMDGRQWYGFQPHGLNPETGETADLIWALENQIEKKIFTQLDVPAEILNTHVTDEATGFNGTAIYLSFYISGCLHVGIQPAGKSKSGSAFQASNFDLRRCSGKAITRLSEQERAESQAKQPSPGAFPASR